MIFSVKKFFVFLFLLHVSLVAREHVIFHGKVEDPSFENAGALEVEILETGETFEVNLGEEFLATLPDDTLWNVCISKKSAGELEKCYEVLYLGSDSSFSFSIGGDFQTATQFDDGSLETIEAPKENLPEDSLSKNEAENAGAMAETIDVESLLSEGNSRTTEMKKVLIQLRRRPKRAAGASVVTAKSIKRMPGLAEADVIRSIQALPGVVASSDFSTKIYVRGGAADQNLFLFDNAIVYSPTHFFGLFSTFLAEGIDDVQFYKSGFPAQYGNRLSSVLKMEGRAGGKDSLDEWFSQSSIKLSTFAAQLHTEGHVGKARWVVAARTTYIGYILDLCQAIGLLDLDIDYEFTDLQGTFFYNFSEDTQLKFSFYTGSDNLAFDPIFVDWGNIAIPINFFHRKGDWAYQATLAFSRFFQSMEIKDFISLGMDLYTFSAKQSLSYRGFENHTLTLGYELEYDDEEFWEDFADTRMMDTPKPFHHVAYFQDAFRFHPDFLFQFGVRFNYQTLASHFGVEPRASLSVQLDETKSLEFYGGHYLQYMNSILFNDRESLNEFYYPAATTTKGKHLKPSSSFLFAIEYKQQNILEDYDFTAGLYYKTQSGLNTFSMERDSSEEASDAFLLADYFGEAEGYSLGYELSIRKEKGAFFGGINWSQGVSVLRANDDPHAYFPSWHQPYALKFDAGINWKGEDGIWPHKKPGRYLRSSIIVKYSAGMPITGYSGYLYRKELGNKEYSDNILVVSGSRNAERQTDYFRVDVKAIDIGRENKWNFSWTIINLTNHDNMFYSFYDTRENPPEYNTISQFPFLPIMLSFEYYF